MCVINAQAWSDEEEGFSHYSLIQRVTATSDRGERTEMKSITAPVNPSSNSITVLEQDEHEKDKLTESEASQTTSREEAWPDIEILIQNILNSMGINDGVNVRLELNV